MNKINKNKSALVNLLLYLKNFKIYVFFIILLCLISTTCLIVGPYILGQITNEIGINYNNLQKYDIPFNFNNINSEILFAILIYAIVFISQIINNIIAVKLSQKLCRSLRKKIYKKIFNIPISYIDNQDSGDIMSLFTNDIDLISQCLSNVLVQILASLITVIGVSIVMFKLNIFITLTIIILIPFLFIFIYIFMKKSQISFNQQQKLLAKLNEHIEESFYGLDTIISYNLFDINIKKFKKYNDELKSVGLKAQFNSRLFLPVMETINRLGYFIVVIMGSIFAIKGFINVGYIQAYIQYVQSFMQPFLSFGQINNYLSQLISASDRVFSFLALEEIHELPIKDDMLKEEITSISFKNVNFSYENNKPILKNININIKKGMKIAIVGSTGSGKTTILNLLLKFYDCNTGEILLNNKNINTFNASIIRKKIAYISQEPWLFDGTIIDNLKFANDKATFEDIVEACKKSYLYSIVQKLPEQFNYYIKNGGTNLSKGQKQLISICRAILANKEILILDEASSSIDALTECYVQEALNKLLQCKTSITVAHRLNTIINSDCIIVLDNGQIVEVGSHKQLINKQGYYNEYYNKQFIVN